MNYELRDMLKYTNLEQYTTHEDWLNAMHRALGKDASDFPFSDDDLYKLNENDFTDGGFQVHLMYSKNDAPDDYQLMFDIPNTNYVYCVDGKREAVFRRGYVPTEYHMQDLERYSGSELQWIKAHPDVKAVYYTVKADRGRYIRLHNTEGSLIHYTNTSFRKLRDYFLNGKELSLSWKTRKRT